PSIGRKINGAIPKLIIKSPIQVSAFDRCAPLYILGLVIVHDPFSLPHLRRGPVLKFPIPSQVPFPDTCRSISGLLQKLWKGNFGPIKERLPERIYNIVLPAPVVRTGK